jgi:DNA-binding NtrC family response regulator
MSDAASRDPSAGSSPKRKPPSGESSRWQAFFQRSGEALFVLNRRRRILFVNRAWVELAGFPADEAHNLVCSRSGPASPGDSLEEILSHALCPPPEVLEGRSGRARRLLPGREASRRWWDVEFFPLREGDSLLCILGRIIPLASEAAEAALPLPEKLVALRERVARRSNFDLLASDTPALRRLAEQVQLASRVAVPVLLVGEPGTGKQTLARIIHFQSAARERPFAVLDCARLPPAAVAAWLFDAHGGAQGNLATVYLKEPAALPRDLQLGLVELLSARNREETSVPRILAGCCTAPMELVRTGSMVEELACALGTLVLEVPPLRQRQLDLAPLVANFLERANAEEGPRVTGLTASAWQVVRAHSWPGNLRELLTVLSTARARARSEHIDAEDLPAALRMTQNLKETPGKKVDPPLSFDQIMKQTERRLIEWALQRTNGHKTRAAEMLGIWRQRLVRRMIALEIAGAEDTEENALEETEDGA